MADQFLILILSSEFICDRHKYVSCNETIHHFTSNITMLNLTVLPGTTVNESGLYTLRIHPTGMTGIAGVAALEVAAHSLEEITQWKSSIQEAIVNLSENQLKLQKEVKRLQIAKEMSDLIVYCRSVPFEMDSKCVCVWCVSVCGVCLCV